MVENGENFPIEVGKKDQNKLKKVNIWYFIFYMYTTSAVFLTISEQVDSVLVLW